MNAKGAVQVERKALMDYVGWRDVQTAACYIEGDAPFGEWALRFPPARASVRWFITALGAFIIADEACFPRAPSLRGPIV